MRRNSDVFMVVLIALWLPAVLLFGSINGCAAGHSGIFRPLSPGAENAITNAIATAATLAPVAVPQPFAAPVQAAAAAVLALLAAWQGLTHRKVSNLVCTLHAPGRSDFPSPRVSGNGTATKIPINPNKPYP